jgi:hypothetical protein
VKKLEDVKVHLFLEDNANNKVDAANSNKKQPVPLHSEAKPTPITDVDAGSDHEDEGQWVTLGNKQVSISKTTNKVIARRR